MSNYWFQREQEELYNQLCGSAQKKIQQNYLRLYKDTKATMLGLYSDINKGDKILSSDLYRFNRYYEFVNTLRSRLVGLSEKELGIIHDSLAEMYKRNSASINQKMAFSILPLDSQVESVINRVWCADGQNWSDRVWNNKNYLAKRIEQGIVDCFARGDSKDKIIKLLEQDFGVGYREAARIVRTELCYVQNQAALDRYRENGVTYFQVVSNQADDFCIDKDKSIFRIDQASIGVNIPPFHPNCRCSIVPVQKE